MKRRVLVLVLILGTMPWATACGGGSKSDTPLDGDTDTVDGDTSEESESPVDGDSTLDGDTAEETEQAADGDPTVEGDTTIDGDTGSDGDSESEADSEVALVWEDSASGLMWQNHDADSELAWASAVAYCDALDLAGYTDWRLPGIGELRSLVRGCAALESAGACNVREGECLTGSCKNESCADCSFRAGTGPGGCYLDAGMVSGAQCPLYYWSSASEGSATAWCLSFESASLRNYGTHNTLGVRCVRAGAVVDGDAESEGEMEPELAGFCSASGAPCDGSVPCATATVEVQGYCSSSALGGNHICLYAPIHPLATDFTCGVNSLSKCADNIDCPLGIGCGGIGSEWCAAGSPGIQGVCLSANTLSGGSTPCTNNNQCTQTLSNVCVICGNSTIESNQEECDDGNRKDGDGCSARCQYEGTCYDSMEGPTGSGCASDADCTGCMGTCSCHMTI